MPNLEDGAKFRQPGFNGVFGDTITDTSQLDPLGVSRRLESDEMGKKSQTTGREPFSVFPRVAVHNKGVVPCLHNVL